MNFSARVQIEDSEHSDAATPTILVEMEADAGKDEKHLFEYLKNVVPAEVEAAIKKIPLVKAGEDSDTDVWREVNADGEEEIHSLAHFGDQEQAHGAEKIEYFKARLIETLQVGENWSRKPRGRWKFGREFSLEDWEAPAPELKPITKDEIESIVEEGVNAMYKAIQDKIGVTTGDNASIYHSGSKIQAQITDFFVEYVRFEKKQR